MSIGADRAVSSVGLERHVDIVEVVGSNPIPPTPPLCVSRKTSLKAIPDNSLQRFVVSCWFLIGAICGCCGGVSRGVLILVEGFLLQMNQFPFVSARCFMA